MSPAILAILTNREVLAIDQDRDGRQGARVWQSGEQEVWRRPLSGGAQAVAIFNRAAADAKVTIKWADIGIAEKLNDFWNAWADVANEPGDLIVRNVVLQKAHELTATMSESSGALGRIVSGLNQQVSEINQEQSTIERTATARRNDMQSLGVQVQS